MVPLPLLTVVPRVRSKFNHLYILPCFSGVMYTHHSFFFFFFGVCKHACSGANIENFLNLLNVFVFLIILNMSLFVINGEWFCVWFFSSLSTSDVEGEKERETKKSYLFDFLHAMLIGLSTSDTWHWFTILYH